LIELPTDELAKSDGCSFDPTIPETVKQFIATYCRLDKGKWQGDLDLLPWQIDFIDAFYGWRDESNGNRFKLGSLWLPKKMGKTTLLGSLATFELCRHNNGELYCLASTVQQAGKLYGAVSMFAKAINRMVPGVGTKERLWIRGNRNTIVDRKSGSVLQILSVSNCGSSGYDAVWQALDELAEWPPAYARTTWERIKHATMAAGGQTISISTANFSRDIGYEHYTAAKKVLDGKSDDTSLLPIVYEVDEHDDWKDENNWWSALPSVPKLVSKDYYRQEFRKCENNPLDEYGFRTFLLNQWTGSPEQLVTSLQWQACGRQFKESDLWGKPAVIGVDYARKYDTCSYCVVVQDGDLYYAMPRFFLPRDIVADYVKTTNQPWDRWAKLDGSNLTLTPDDEVDPRYLRQAIEQDANNFHIEKIYYDPTYFAESRQLLTEAGFECIEVPPYANHLHEPTGMLQRLVLTKKLVHPSNPILDHMLGNCIPQIDKHDRIKVTRASNTQKIDGIDALINCLKYWSDTHEPKPPADARYLEVW